MKNINWWMIAFIAAAVAWGFREGCGCVKKKDDPYKDGLLPSTVYLPGKDSIIIDTQYVPEPKKLAKSNGAKDRYEKQKWDRLNKFPDVIIGDVGLPMDDGRKVFIDSNGVLYSDKPAQPDREVNWGDHVFTLPRDTAYYRDSLPVSYGYAIIQDTVAGNRITGRNFRLNQSLPVVRETVAEKKRNVVYLGLNAQGSKQNFFYSIGADVSLKAKNDRIYSLGVGVTRDNQLLYGAGFRWPMRLRK